MTSNTVPVIQPPEPDDKANQEANSFANETYEEEERKNEHGRKERIRKHISDAVVVLFWVAVISVAIMGVTLVYHMVMPIKAHYLSEDQLSRIQGMLFSGVVASALPAYVKKYI